VLTWFSITAVLPLSGQVITVGFTETSAVFESTVNPSVLPKPVGSILYSAGSTATIKTTAANRVEVMQAKINDLMEALGIVFIIIGK
jgi:hypothetical protein